MKQRHVNQKIFIFLTVIFFSCQAKTSIPAKEPNEKMTSQDVVKKESISFTISGKVQQVTPYCGGARPTQEMLDRMAKPVPYPGKKFYVKAGKVNNLKAKIVASFISGNLGDFSIQLAPGTYSFLLEEQLHEINPQDYENENQKVDAQCLKEWWLQPYYLLEVKDKNVVDLNFIFSRRCFISVDLPCITYTGPFPP